MRYHMADNMMLHLSYTPMKSMMVSVKQMFGYVCLGGCVFFLLLLLCDVQPVRSTLKKIPYWNYVGRMLRRDVLSRAK